MQTWYLNNNPDLKKVYGTDLVAAIQHWLTWGVKEGRQASPDFSAVIYLNRYKDVAAVFGRTNYAAAIQHYIYTVLKKEEVASKNASQFFYNN